MPKCNECFKILIDKESGLVQAFNERNLAVFSPMFLRANRKDQLLFDLVFGPSDYVTPKKKRKKRA